VNFSANIYILLYVHTHINSRASSKQTAKTLAWQNTHK